MRGAVLLFRKGLVFIITALMIPFPKGFAQKSRFRSRAASRRWANAGRLARKLHHSVAQVATQSGGLPGVMENRSCSDGRLSCVSAAWREGL